MAELFGTIAGALSVAALFNNCVDCFAYIQLGRRFGRDFEKCQLKLDIAKTRLSRWGQAIAINDDPSFASPTPDEKSALLVRAILEEIALLFQSIQKTSKRYEIAAPHEDLLRLENSDMSPVSRKVHNRLEAVASRRQKGTSLLKKAAWALYDGKHFEKLISEITFFITELEQLYPVQEMARQLAEFEIEELDDEPSLLALKEAASDTDLVLSDIVAQKALEITGRNHAGEVKVADTTKVHIGNQWTEVAISRQSTMSDRIFNSTESLTATGNAAIQIGNRYGGRGIFDD